MAIRNASDRGIRTNPMLFHVNARVRNGNAIANTIAATQAFCGHAAQTAAADKDVFEQDVYLKAGTYTFRVVGYANDDCGKIDWRLDNISLAVGQDWYAAAPAVNTVKDTASVKVPEEGWYRLVGSVNGKNASSSAYKMCLTYYTFIPTN